MNSQRTSEPGRGPDSTSSDPAAGQAEDPAVAVAREHARSVYRLADAMQRWGLMLSLPASLVVVGVATVLAGRPGLVGAAFGVVLGQGSALVTITMMRMAATRGPSSLMGFALGGYALKMTALLVVMLLLRDVDGFNRTALAFGMLVVVVAWAAGEVTAFQKTRTPTLVVPPSQPLGGDDLDDLEDTHGREDHGREDTAETDDSDLRDESSTRGETTAENVTSSTSGRADSERTG